jgi:hypothetical protein
MMHRGLVGIAALTLVACGSGDTESALPDESKDLNVGSSGGMGGVLEGTKPASPELDGTQWKWVEAHCTTGPLKLGEKRGFSQQVRVSLDSEGLLFVYDQVFEKENCRQTIVQRAIPGKKPDDEWQMKETAHVSMPPDCGIGPEHDRPGNVRMRGEFLEVFVQRSKWCGGYEVRMVYAPMQNKPLEGRQLVRHYTAHFNRQDADRVSALFADTGSLVEPFTESATGSTRHEGIGKVRSWYAKAFGNVPWLALRLTSVQSGDEEGQFIADWKYMDPRVQEPFPGKNVFTVGGGEIFETRIELRGSPKESEAFAKKMSGEAKGAGKDGESGQGDSDDGGGDAQSEGEGSGTEPSSESGSGGSSGEQDPSSQTSSKSEQS